MNSNEISSKGVLIDEKKYFYYNDSVTETKQYASVTDSGTQTMLLVYGKIKQGSLTIRLQNHISEPFDRIRIGDKHYSVDMMRTLCRMQVLIVSEVQ